MLVDENQRGCLFFLCWLAMQVIVCFVVDVESAVIKLGVLSFLLTTWLTCDGISCPFLPLKSFEEMADHLKTEVIYVNPDTYARL